MCINVKIYCSVFIVSYCNAFMCSDRPFCTLFVLGYYFYKDFFLAWCCCAIDTMFIYFDHCLASCAVILNPLDLFMF